MSIAMMAHVVDKPDWLMPGSFYNSSPALDQQALLEWNIMILT